MTRRAAASVLLALASMPAWAADPSALVLSGHVVHPRTVTPAELARLPQGTETAAQAGHPSGAGGQVTGAHLWPLLDAAGWVDAPGRKTHLQHVVLARGRDGYAVALSIGEIDPALEGKDVLVVTGPDGKLGLFVPGDRRAARRVHDLVGLEVQ